MSDRVDIKTVSVALGISKQATLKREKRESWPFEEESVRGGKKRIYSLASLPKAVREAILHHTIKNHQSAGVLAISPAALSAAPPSAVPFYPIALPVSHELKDWQRR